MSTNTLTESEPTTALPERRPTRIRYALASALLGLAAAGAVVLTTGSDGSTSPAPRPSAPATTVYASSYTEIFAGCMNDLECTGEPSHLPSGYWDAPAGSVD